MEKEFIQSWDKIEEFYSDLLKNPGWEYVKPIQPIISELRQKGYDTLLRAGQSIHILTLSRSMKHGLIEGQHRIQIEPLPDEKFEIRYHNVFTMFKKFQTKELIGNIELNKLLDELTKQEIN